MATKKKAPAKKKEEQMSEGEHEIGQQRAEKVDLPALSTEGWADHENALMTVANQEPSPMMADPYRGMSVQAFPEEAAKKLMAPLDPNDVEIRPDGMVYLPEIKYRRILNKAFGPGAWAIVPKDEYTEQDGTLSRTYSLYVLGRFVSEARGEQDYIPNNDNMSYATAAEGLKSNALMRCCKDLGIASELWDPGYIEQWQEQFAVQVWRDRSKFPRPQWRRKDRKPFYDEQGLVGGQQTKTTTQPKSSDEAGVEKFVKDTSSKESPPKQSDSPKVYVITEKHKTLRTEILDFVGTYKAQVATELGIQLTGDEKKDLGTLAGATLRQFTAFGEGAKRFPGRDKVEHLSEKQVGIALHTLHETRKNVEQQQPR